MPLDRREFLSIAAGSAVAATLKPALAIPPAPGSRYRAVAFDAFPVFDPRPIAALAESLFPGKGAELGNAWRTRQFEYQWLRTLSGRYADFLRTTEDALVFAARQVKLELTSDRRARLMDAYRALDVWPDAAPSLRSMKEAGIRLAFVSNMTTAMLEAGLERAGLRGVFEHVLGTDRIGAHKPDPRAYRMGADALGLPREEILFAAFAGWDVAGAKWFGYPTYWVNRLGVPAEELGVAPDATGRDLTELAAFVKAAR